MPALDSFDYAIVRVVPCVEREEFINAGVILFCRTQKFLDALIALDRSRLAVLAPHLNPAEVELHLSFIPIICAGGEAAGPIGQLPLADRFHWLVSPHSTVVQTSPVHTGLCSDPSATLRRLLETMVCLNSLPPN